MAVLPWVCSIAEDLRYPAVAENADERSRLCTNDSNACDNVVNANRIHELNGRKRLKRYLQLRLQSHVRDPH